MNRPARVSIQAADFDLSAEVAALRAGDGHVGAVATFIGTVRERSGGGPAISAMELEHYPGMTEAAIEAMIDAAMRRFDIRQARVVHRVGLLQPLEQIVLVSVASAHRGQAFQACEFLMDYLKTQAPFWKKETSFEGAQWVDARVADDEALARWGIGAGNAVIASSPGTPGGANDAGSTNGAVDTGSATNAEHASHVGIAGD
ncbi:MAG: molybdenum cofactor biosynthesis protein MoaE [Rubrivivax sp.]|nr:molybdenum cofactor biosynthesis protein MoaE [Rubrivivax sp.]